MAGCEIRINREIKMMRWEVNCDEKSEKMSIVDISLKEITFCSHTNEDISNLRMIIKAIEEKKVWNLSLKR